MGWQLIVFETGEPTDARAVLAEGERIEAAGLSVSFAGMSSLPSAVVNMLPGAQGQAVAELSRRPQESVLTVGPVQGQALALSSGESAVLGGYEYTFAGEREFTDCSGAVGTARREPRSNVMS